MLRLDVQGRPLRDRGRVRGFMWWVDSLSDSLNLSFVNGFSGAVLILAPRMGSDTLYGRIEEHWDFGPPFMTSQQSAFAVHVPCRES